MDRWEQNFQSLKSKKRKKREKYILGNNEGEYITKKEQGAR